MKTPTHPIRPTCPTHPARPARPAPSRLRPVAPLLAAALALAGAAPAGALTHNVSALVKGAHELVPLWPLDPPPAVPCGTACQYVNASAAAVSDAYGPEPAPLVLGGTWPPPWVAAMPGIPTVSLALPLPPVGAGVVRDGGAIGAAQGARAEFDWLPQINSQRELIAQTWKTGSGVAVASYAIRLTTLAGAQRTWLEVGIPSLARGFQWAYDVGGPSGQQPIYSAPDSVQARSAVDVYVDGLPVWSSESNLLKPRRYSAPYIANVALSWGHQALDEGTATLFLGTLPAGSTRTVAVVIRTDLRANAPDCDSDSVNGTSVQRCHSQREMLKLPAMAVSSGGPLSFISYRPHLRIYTR